MRIRARSRVLFALACVLVAGWLVRSYVRRRPGPLPDLDGTPITLDDVHDAAGVDPAPTGGRFMAPAQDLDVPLAEMSPTGGVISAPSLTEAFLVRGFGTPADPATGLTIVTMHAVCGARAPGNTFYDMCAERPRVTVSPGDALVVDGVRYVVTEVELLGRSAATCAVWTPAPDRGDELVVLTSLHRERRVAREEEHLVLFAKRDAQPGG